MNFRLDLDPRLHSALKSIYEEVMWLSVRPNVTLGRARAWYTHSMAEAVKRKLCRFTGKVSETAAKGMRATCRIPILDSGQSGQMSQGRCTEEPWHHQPQAHQVSRAQDRLDTLFNSHVEAQEVAT